MPEGVVSEIVTRAIRMAGAQNSWPQDVLDRTLARGVRLEWPKKEEFGDLSTPMAMSLAKDMGKTPRHVAGTILESLRQIPETSSLFSKVDIAGPGYLNFFFSSPYFSDFLVQCLSGSALVDRVAIPKKINVEFVSANPTGPLHVGHGRGAAFGDSLARILREVGHDVSTEYYINDAGNQMNMLGKSVYLAFRKLTGHESSEEKVRLLGDTEGYRGDYIAGIAKEILDNPKGLPDGLREDVLAGRFTDQVQSFFTDVSQRRIMEGIREDLDRFGVTFDRYFSEKTLHEKGADGLSSIARWLTRLEKESDGAVYASEGALWFRTTAMADDKDRVLRKSDGSYTYFAADIAYHADKVDRGYDIMVDVWGADHHGYQARMQAVAKVLSDRAKRQVDLKICLIQLVSLLRDGKAVSMSTRAGEFVTLAEVLDEVGVDATRFSYLTRSHESALEFDLSKAKERSMDNPVYYVQYAHARVKSLLAQAKSRGVAIGDFHPEDFSPLEEPAARSLIRLMAQFSGVLHRAAESFEVHPLTDYLTALAGAYHHYYFHHRILSAEDADRPVMMARIGLSMAVGRILASGLALLGVRAPDSM